MSKILSIGQKVLKYIRPSIRDKKIHNFKYAAAQAKRELTSASNNPTSPPKAHLHGTEISETF